MAAKRPRVGHTEEFQKILPLCWWPEQVEYERIRQPVLFGDPVAERARETGVSEATLRRRIGRFEAAGMGGCSPRIRPASGDFRPTCAGSSWT